MIVYLIEKIYLDRVIIYYISSCTYDNDYWNLTKFLYSNLPKWN